MSSQYRVSSVSETFGTVRLTNWNAHHHQLPRDHVPLTDCTPTNIILRASGTHQM